MNPRPQDAGLSGKEKLGVVWLENLGKPSHTIYSEKSHHQEMQQPTGEWKNTEILTECVVQGLHQGRNKYSEETRKTPQKRQKWSKTTTVKRQEWQSTTKKKQKKRKRKKNFFFFTLCNINFYVIFICYLCMRVSECVRALSFIFIVTLFHIKLYNYSCCSMFFDVVLFMYISAIGRNMDGDIK